METKVICWRSVATNVDKQDVGCVETKMNSSLFDINKNTLWCFIGRTEHVTLFRRAYRPGRTASPSLRGAVVLNLEKECVLFFGCSLDSASGDEVTERERPTAQRPVEVEREAAACVEIGIAHWVTDQGKTLFRCFRSALH